MNSIAYACAQTQMCAVAAILVLALGTGVLHAVQEHSALRECADML